MLKVHAIFEMRKVSYNMFLVNIHSLLKELKVIDIFSVQNVTQLPDPCHSL